MDNEQFLQYLRDHALEEGYAYIQEHSAELSEHAAFALFSFCLAQVG